MLGLEAISSEIRRAEDIGAAFEALKDRVHALYVGADPLALTQVIRIALLSGSLTDAL